MRMVKLTRGNPGVAYWVNPAAIVHFFETAAGACWVYVNTGAPAPQSVLCNESADEVAALFEAATGG